MYSIVPKTTIFLVKWENDCYGDLNAVLNACSKHCFAHLSQGSSDQTFEQPRISLGLLIWARGLRTALRACPHSPYSAHLSQGSPDQFWTYQRVFGPVSGISTFLVLLIWARGLWTNFGHFHISLVLLICARGLRPVSSEARRNLSSVSSERASLASE